MSKTDSERLEQAIFDDDYERISALCEVVKSLDHEEYWSCPVHLAARLGRMNAIRALAEHDFDLNRLGVDGATPIMTAILTRHPDIVRQLLEFGADPDVRKSASHETAILYALWRKRLPQAAQVLVEYGADVFATDANGNNAIRRAIFFKCEEVLQYLPKKLDTQLRKETARARLDFGLIECVRAGELETAAELLQKGANPNALDPFGTFALYYAASIGSLPLIDLLLEEGADINLQGSVEKSALMQAAYQGHREIVDKLIDSGADLLAECQLSDTESLSVADFAREGAHIELSKSLKTLQEKRR